MKMSGNTFTDLLTAALVSTASQRFNSPCEDIVLNSEIRKSKANFK